MNVDDPKYKHAVRHPGCRPTRPRVDPWTITGAEMDAIKARHDERERQWEYDLNAWSAEDRRVNEAFRHDALEAVGLLGHPKEAKAWEMAWDRGHANGFADVYWQLEELGELLRD